MTGFKRQALQFLCLNIQSNVPNPRVFLLSPRDWLLMSRTDFKEQFMKTPALLYTGTRWQHLNLLV